MPPREHDLHNALFALDDALERLDAVITGLAELKGSLGILQGYLERLL
jgi:hypothetical protein